jgi:hypothetical protein
MITLYGFGRVHRQVIGETRDHRSVDLRPAHSTRGAAQTHTKEN